MIGFFRRLGAIVLVNAQMTLRDPVVPIFLVITPLAMIAVIGKAIGEQAGAGTSPYGYSVPTLSVFFLFFLVTATVNMVYRDAYWFTWPQILALVPKGVLLSGKVIAGTFVGFLQLAVVWALSWPLFGFHGISDPRLLVLGAGVAAVAAALGVAIASVSRSLELSIYGANLLVIVFGCVGGALVPTSSLPSYARALGYATPQYWTVRALSHQAGAGSMPLAATVAVLAAMAIGFTTFAVAVIRYHRLARA